MFDPLINQLRRRTFLRRSAMGVGSMALGSLLGKSLSAAAPDPDATSWTGVVDPLHFAPKAKRVIFLTLRHRTFTIFT